MFKPKNKDLYLDEGDYGVSLKLNLNKSLYQTGDVVKFTVKANSDIKVTEDLEVIISETEAYVILEITKEITEKLPYGDYVYGLKHYRDNQLLNTIVKSNSFFVEKGA